MRLPKKEGRAMQIPNQPSQKAAAEPMVLKCATCRVTAEAQVATGRVLGAAFKWVRPPSGWWVYMSRVPLDTDNLREALHVRCPKCLCPELASKVASNG